MAAGGFAVVRHDAADRRASGHGAHARVSGARDPRGTLAVLQEPGALYRLHVVAVVPEPGSAASGRLVQGFIHTDQPDPGRAARSDHDQRAVAAALLQAPLATARLAG